MQLNNSLSTKLVAAITSRFTERRMVESDILCQKVNIPMDGNMLSNEPSEAEINEYVRTEIEIAASEIDDPVLASINLGV